MATADHPGGWTDERLKAELRAALAERAASTEKVARLWVEAKRRGVLDLPATGSTYWFDAVATGTLRGGLVDLFHGDFVVLRRLSTLTLADQDRVLSGEKFEVWDGRQVVKAAVSGMNAAQVMSLIQHGTIVQPVPQPVAAKPAPKVEPKADPDPPRRYTPKVDHERGHVLVNNSAVPIPAMLEALAKKKPDKPPPLGLHGEDVKRAGCEVIGVMLWNEEFDRLSKAAKRAGLPTAELIRKAVVAYLGAVIDG